MAVNFVSTGYILAETHKFLSHKSRIIVDEPDCQDALPIPTDSTSSSPALLTDDNSCETNAVAADSYDKTVFEQAAMEYSDVIVPPNELITAEYLQNTVFIGDSNTEGLKLYGYLEAKNVLGKRSMAIGQVLTDEFVAFDDFSHSVTAIKAAQLLVPERIIINFGTNNANGTDTDTFAYQYRKVLTALKQSCPQSEIIVAAVLPVGYYRENRRIKQQTIDDFNIALMQLCRENGYSFLNYAALFKDDTGYMNSEFVSDDGIHLNSKGYTRLLDYINSHQLITTDEVTAPDVPGETQGTCDIPCEKIIYDPF